MTEACGAFFLLPKYAVLLAQSLRPLLKCLSDAFMFSMFLWSGKQLTDRWSGQLQVVYAVANEGSRLEIPEGPLGRLIAGKYSEISEFSCVI